MRLVLDASVALKWVLPEVDSRLAIGLRDDFQRHLHEFHSPDVFPLDCAHTLAKKLSQARHCGQTAR